MVRHWFKRWFPVERHASDEELVLFLENELSRRRGLKIQKHMAACWSCRVRGEQLAGAVARFVSSRNAWFERSGGCPAAVGRSFDARLKRQIKLDQEQKRRSRGTGIWVRFAVPAMAVLGLAVFTLRLITVPAVSAQAALDRSSTAQTRQILNITAPVVYQKLLVSHTQARTGKQDSVTVETWNYPNLAGKAAKPEQEVWREVRGILRKNGLDEPWPLSAVAYQNWRKSTRIRDEHVVETRLANGDTGYRIETAVEGPFSSDEIVESHLELRARDWQPVRQSLTVRAAGGVQRYEVAQLDFSVVSLNTLRPSVAKNPTSSGAALSVVDPVIAPSAAAPETTISEQLLDEAEMEARYTVHQFGKCLGDAVRVVRKPGVGIGVRGVLETLADREDLLAAFGEFEPVTVELQVVEEMLRQAAAAPAVDPASASAPRITFRSEKLPLQDRLTAYFSARAPAADVPAAAARLADEAVTLSRGALDEAWALRRLAEAYLPVKVSSLRPPHRRLLEGMVEDHLQSLRAKLAAFHTLVAPVLQVEGNGLPPAMGEERVHNADWQDAALRLFEVVQAAARRSNGLFAGLDLRPDTAGEAAGALLAALPYCERLAIELELQAAAELGRKHSYSSSQDPDGTAAPAGILRRQP